MTKNKLLILLGIVAVAALLYQGIVGLCGFTKTWSTWRQLSFIGLNVVCFFVPGVVLLWIHEKSKQ